MFSLKKIFIFLWWNFSIKNKTFWNIYIYLKVNLLSSLSTSLLLFSKSPPIQNVFNSSVKTSSMLAGNLTYSKLKENNSRNIITVNKMWSWRKTDWKEIKWNGIVLLFISFFNEIQICQGNSFSTKCLRQTEVLRLESSNPNSWDNIIIRLDQNILC
jgi:hypothetical protein